MSFSNKLALIILVLLAGALGARAQIQVLQFTEVTSDLDARTNYPMNDPTSRGKKCAIIKVADPDMGFSFDLGNLDVVDIVKKPEMAETWLYVPVGTNKIKIGHARYGQLDTSDGFYWFPNGIRCESAKVYRLRLNHSMILDDDIVTDQHKFATVVFNVFPKSAEVILRKMPEQTDAQGRLEKRVPLGKFHYSVSASDYHATQGSFEVTKAGETVTVNVNLRQAYGWLALSSAFPAQGATFLVDSSKVELASSSRLQLHSGKHKVLVRRPHYRDLLQDVEITDSTVFDYNPQMVPILGTLQVDSKRGATVKVDGKELGTLPFTAPQRIIEGKHTVEVSMLGFRTETREVEIRDGQTTSLSVDLVDMATFKFTSTPSGAVLYVNGEHKGITPCSLDYASGDYTVRLTYKKYKDYKKKVHFDSSNPQLDIKLKRIYNSKNELYIEGTMRAGSFVGVGATIGGYLYNVNAEASFFYGIGKSEQIYWCGNDLMPVEASYSPSINMSIKTGYGFALGTRFRLTPQVGINLLKLKETADSHEQTLGNDANATSFLVGLRFSAAIVKHFAISLSPEYSFPIKKSTGYEALSEVSPKIKKWSQGFNAKLGITLFF